MLVATFAVAFLLQSIALLRFGALGKIAASLAHAQPAGDDRRRGHPQDRDRRDRVAVDCLAPLVLVLERTTVGLQMRAAALDFETARLLGVRANRVIGAAVLVSGALAAVVAVMLTVQNPLVTPDFALNDTIVVLAGVVVGGLNRLVPATWAGSRSASRAACSGARCRRRRASTCRPSSSRQ